MKNFLNLVLGFVVMCPLAFSKEARVIEMKAEKVDGKVHWLPGKVQVKPGETVQFKVNYNLEGGFDFHGFSIPALNVVSKVDRNKPLVLEKKVPETLAPGEYPITCQFHPAHVAATLVVEKPKGK